MEPSHRFLIVNHGGMWSNTIYEGGRKECIPIPPCGIKYDDLVSKLEVRLKKDKKFYSFDIDSIVKTPAGDNMMMKITDDFELSYLMGLLDVPTIYVDVCSLGFESSHSMTNISTTDGGDAGDIVMHNGGGDDVIMTGSNDPNEVEDSSNVVDASNVYNFGAVDMVPLSNESNEEGHYEGRVWTVPGASYHACVSYDEVDMPDDEVLANELILGGTFCKKSKMKLALGMYHMKGHLQYRTVRSNKKSYHIICKFNDRCGFVMKAKSVGSAWSIYLWNSHTCENDFRYHAPPAVPSRVLAAYFEPNLSSDGSVLKPRDMQSQLLRELGVNVNYQAALCGRNIALAQTHGDAEKSFQVLSHYLYMLKLKNPGSIVALQTSADSVFEYCFFALSACVRAFRACRPVIVIDGTHLKGKWKGIMFIAATKDANEQIVPLAFAIGDKENDSSWTWFLHQVRRTFGCPNDLLIVSDQHVSISNAIETVYGGTAHHGLCTFHMQGNLKTWGKVAIDLFKLAANSYRRQDFEEHMRNLESSLPNAHAKVMSIDPRKWAVSFSPVRRFRCGTSNAAESLNSKLLWARELPVCRLLEAGRKMLQDWFYKRRTRAAARDHEITYFAATKLSKAVEAGRCMNVEPVNATVFKVSSESRSCVVDIAARKCSCLSFDLNLIPCSHATAAISFAKQSPVSYVHPCYSTETWREIYAGEVMPVPDVDEWCVPPEISSVVVITPNNPKQAGRPRTKRIPSEGVSVRNALCSRCHQKGHYRNTCGTILPNNHQGVSSNQAISNSQGVSSNEASTSKARKQNKCGICGVAGHTRASCKDPSRFA